MAHGKHVPADGQPHGSARRRPRNPRARMLVWGIFVTAVVIAVVVWLVIYLLAR